MNAEEATGGYSAENIKTGTAGTHSLLPKIGKIREKVDQKLGPLHILRNEIS